MRRYVVGWTDDNKTTHTKTFFTKFMMTRFIVQKTKHPRFYAISWKYLWGKERGEYNAST